jgi:phosphate transport system protein
MHIYALVYVSSEFKIGIKDSHMVEPTEGHIIQRYDGELGQLHILILEMGGLVLDQVRNAINAVVNKDLEAAALVLRREPDVDALEIKVDNETVSLIARRSPVGSDLRIVTAISKAVTDLERIGDEAARIAGIAESIYGNNANEPGDSLLRDISTMGKLALDTLVEALDIFDKFDLDRAEQLTKCDTELDAEFQSSLRRLTTFVLEDARNVGHTINIVLILKDLERIGEHAKNLAEYIIFFLKGEDVRHQIVQESEKV